MAPFGFPPRPSGILLLLSLSEAFLSALSFLSFDPKMDSLEDLVGVSAFAAVDGTLIVGDSFSTVVPLFSLSFRLVPPTPSFVPLPHHHHLL